MTTDKPLQAPQFQPAYNMPTFSQLGENKTNGDDSFIDIGTVRITSYEYHALCKHIETLQPQPAPPSAMVELSPLDEARLATQQEVEDGDLTVEDFDQMERHQWNKALEAAARIADREEKTYESGDLHEAATNARYIAHYIRELRR